MTLTMPAQATKLEADIDGGVGQTRIYIPDGADMHLDVEGGVGSVELVVPPNTAIRLEATSGLGSVNVPLSFVKVQKKDFTGGVWQTEGFELAERKVYIDYEGGIGQMTVREAEII
jgi:predicted membrane protein